MVPVTAEFREKSAPAITFVFVKRIGGAVPRLISHMTIMSRLIGRTIHGGCQYLGLEGALFNQFFGEQWPHMTDLGQ